MYRLLISIITYLLVSVHVAQAQEDIVMKINGLPIYKSEFVKSFSQSNATSAKEYLPQFLLHKVRVLDLKEKGIDTLTSFKILLANYKGEIIKSRFVSGKNHSKKIEQINNRFADYGWLKCQIIEQYVPQNSSSSYLAKQKTTADSIYSLLIAGADINKISSIRSGLSNITPVEWIRKCNLPSEVQQKLDGAKKGDILQPVLTSSGYVILKIDDVSYNYPSELVERDICNSINPKDVSNIMAEINIDDIKDELLYNISIKNDTTSSVIDENQLLDYYNHNKSKFYYDTPRFKGAVIHCSSKKAGKVIKKYLKRYDSSNWQDALDKLIGSESQKNVVIETGLFKKGDNKWVDKLVFKQGGDMVYSQSLPYSFTLGKVYKKKPGSFSDVRLSVAEDYKNRKMMEQNGELFKKYNVEIVDDVLKTVNNSGSN